MTEEIPCWDREHTRKECLLDRGRIENFEMVTEEFDRRGFATLEAVISDSEIRRFLTEMDGRENSAGIRQPHVEVTVVIEMAGSKSVRELVEPLLGREARVVRSILFDKTAEKNWGVPWHQDLTIAVAERREVSGFVGWSVKDGVNHVQAPREVLEGMLTVRLHLDDCGPENGPLRVLPGTHRGGWLDSEAIEKLKRELREEACVVKRGGVVLMRPLLLHASSRATNTGHRRVLHLEFAVGELPGGLRFFARGQVEPMKCFTGN